MRTITVVLRIKDQDAAGVIWDSHMQDSLLFGCTVQAIANGDVLARLDRAEELLTDESFEKLQEQFNEMLPSAAVKEAQCQKRAEHEKKKA